MVGAADLPADHLAHGEIGAQMRAIGALYHGLAGPVPIEDDAGAQKVPADHLAALTSRASASGNQD